MLKDEFQAELQAARVTDCVVLNRPGHPYLSQFGLGPPVTDDIARAVANAVARFKAKHPNDGIVLTEDPDSL